MKFCTACFLTLLFYQFLLVFVCHKTRNQNTVLSDLGFWQTRSKKDRPKSSWNSCGVNSGWNGASKWRGKSVSSASRKWPCYSPFRRWSWLQPKPALFWYNHLHKGDLLNSFIFFSCSYIFLAFLDYLLPVLLKVQLFVQPNSIFCFRVSILPRHCMQQITLFLLVINSVTKWKLHRIPFHANLLLVHWKTQLSK